MAPGRPEALDDQGPAGPAHPGMQVVEHPLQPVVRQRPGPEGHVRLDPVPQPRPVRLDQQLPALREQVRDQVPGGGRIIQQLPRAGRDRGAVPFGQRPAHLVGDLLRRRGPDPGQLAGDVRAGGVRDRAEEVRGPAAPGAERSAAGRRSSRSACGRTASSQGRWYWCRCGSAITRTACIVSQSGETTNRVRAGSSGPNTMVRLIAPSPQTRDSAAAESLASMVAAGQPRSCDLFRPGEPTGPRPPPRPRPGRARYRDVLGQREFRALFLANIVSMLGNVVAAVALTVLVYEQTRSPALAASVMALAFLPYLLGGVLLGAAADRLPARGPWWRVTCSARCWWRPW